MIRSTNFHRLKEIISTFSLHPFNGPAHSCHARCDTKFISTNSKRLLAYLLCMCENILFVDKPIKRQVSPIFYDQFTIPGDLHRYKSCWSVTDHLNIPTFRSQKYGRFSTKASTIDSWNSMQNLLIKNFSLKNSTSNKIKYFLTKLFIEKY